MRVTRYTQGEAPMTQRKPVPTVPTHDGAGRLGGNIEKVFFGKSEAVRHILTALLAEGHILIEDVPGVGKTTLARALARSISCEFRRVQFTPDLLPSDVIGVSIYSQDKAEFQFKPGPLFANVVLADEINRSTPRTQSALLEAMNDSQVSVDGTTHTLPKPFMVVATQNPYEFEGTYPLPESQLDRFLLRIRIGYPSIDSEEEVLRSQSLGHPLDDLVPVLSTDDVREIQERVKQVKVDDALLRYCLEIAAATRESERLDMGVSPRGTLALRRASQARAYLANRAYVTPDDVKALVVPVLSHRVIPRSGYAGASDEAAGILTEILADIPVPV